MTHSTKVAGWVRFKRKSGSILLDNQQLLEGINQFLADLPETERKVFMYRYWNLDSIERISKRYGYSTSKVTSMLYRIRGKFRKFLETEEYL